MELQQIYPVEYLHKAIGPYPYYVDYNPDMFRTQGWFRSKEVNKRTKAIQKAHEIGSIYTEFNFKGYTLYAGNNVSTGPLLNILIDKNLDSFYNLPSAITTLRRNFHAKTPVEKKNGVVDIKLTSIHLDNDENIQARGRLWNYNGFGEIAVMIESYNKMRLDKKLQPVAPHQVPFFFSLARRQDGSIAEDPLGMNTCITMELDLREFDQIAA